MLPGSSPKFPITYSCIAWLGIHNLLEALPRDYFINYNWQLLPLVATSIIISSSTRVLIIEMTFSNGFNNVKKITRLLLFGRSKNHSPTILICPGLIFEGDQLLIGRVEKNMTYDIT